MRRRHRVTAPAVIQLMAAVVDGVALSTIVLHVTEHVGLAPGATGLVLSAAAAVALVVAGPLGVVADRVGLPRAGCVATLGSAAALLGYAIGDSLAAYAVSAVLFVVAQAVAGAIRQALAVAGAPAAERLRVRATMHTLLNVGLGIGTLVGASVAAAGSASAFRTAYVAAGLLSLCAAVATCRVRSVDHDRPAVARPAAVGLVLRDHHFVTATGLASIVQLTMPALSVLLPVWVLQHTVAPAWTAGAALAANTALVIAAQRPWSGRLGSARAVTESAYVAAVALVTAGALFTLSGRLDSPRPAFAVIVLAVVALTAGEVAGGAATWAVALSDVPPDAEGRYQSVFSMGSSTARIVGPGVALPLVVGLPAIGWLLLGLTMATACLGVARLAASPTHHDLHLTERNTA